MNMAFGKEDDARAAWNTRPFSAAEEAAKQLAEWWASQTTDNQISMIALGVQISGGKVAFDGLSAAVRGDGGKP
jgi:hypothetical protein